jgi:hypothetical protein
MPEWNSPLATFVCILQVSGALIESSLFFNCRDKNEANQDRAKDKIEDQRIERQDQRVFWVNTYLLLDWYNR